MTQKELFAIVDKRWKWVTRNESGSVYLHKDRPKLAAHCWDPEDADNHYITDLFTIDFSTDDWTKCIARRDDIDMDEVLRIYEDAYECGKTLTNNRINALTVVVEYVRKQLEQE